VATGLALTLGACELESRFLRAARREQLWRCLMSTWATICARVALVTLITFVGGVVVAGDVYSSSGKGALANLTRQSPDGCGYENISISAAETVQRNPPGGPSFNSVAGIVVFSADFCTSTFSMLSGVVTDPDFRIDTALRKATLDTVITACDSWGLCHDVDVHLVWTGAGDSGPTLTTMHTPWFFNTYRSNARDATLSGTVFDAGVDIIEGLSAFAQLTANAGHTRFR
jgi:hypothetical protein